MTTNIQKLLVSDVMEINPVTLSASVSVYAGLQELTRLECRGAPVVDDKQCLLGFVSQQDLLRCLWAEEYALGVSDKVGDLMQTLVLTVSPQDSVIDLLELMVVDREKLFPVNDNAFMVGSSYQSYETRLRSASAAKPSVYPVVDNGVLCGIITREAIAKKVCQSFAVT